MILANSGIDISRATCSQVKSCFIYDELAYNAGPEGTSISKLNFHGSESLPPLGSGGKTSPTCVRMASGV